MTVPSAVAGVVRHLSAASDDADLLARYVVAGDQAAFAAVVGRYGGLVLGVARRQLADPGRAEDVFQATFLALARAAGRLRRQTPLANWLYTVALRQARKARARDARRNSAERALPAPSPAADDPLDAISGRDLLRVIDDELARLPDRYRLPVLLCCVQGLSRDEAAARLGWEPGSVKGRLERGRRVLAERLTARGLAPAALVAPLAMVAVPPGLAARTLVLAGAPWAKTVPASVAALAAAAKPVRFLPAAAVVCGLAAAGFGGWAVVPTPNDPPPAAAGKPADPPPAAPPAVAVPGDPLPAGAVVRFGTSRYRHGTRIASLGVSRDGRFAVASSGGHVNGATRGYDLSDGRAVFTLGRPRLEFRDPEAVTVSPDGKTVAVKLSSKIGLYDAATGAEVRVIALKDTGGGTLTEWITYSPDGKYLALTQGESHGVVLVDVEKGEVARTFPHTNVVYACAFSRDGTRMAAGGYDQEGGNYVGRLWDVATGKPLGTFSNGGNAIRSLAWSPDGKTLAGAGDGGIARLWDASTGAQLRALPKDGDRTRAAAFSPDGRLLAIGGDAVRVYDPATGTPRYRVERKASHIQFSADGEVLIAAVGGTIARWDAKLGLPLELTAGADSPIDQLAVAYGGKVLITRGQDGDAHVWEAATGRHEKRLPVAWQHGMAVSPDGRYVVWAAEDERIKYKDARHPNAIHTGHRLAVYDREGGLRTERGPGFEGDAFFITFAPDGKTLTGLGRDGTVWVLDFETGKVLRSFRAVGEDQKDQSWVAWHAALSPDGKTLGVSYQPRQRGGFGLGPIAVRLWDVATGRDRFGELEGHRGYVEAVAFSPDGRFLVTGDRGGFFNAQGEPQDIHLFVWEVATGKRVPRLEAGLPGGAVAAAFSPDGRTLATADPDGTIRLWEVASWSHRATFKGHRDRVNALTFGPDGRLYSGGNDTTALAWDVRPAKGTAGALDEAWKALAVTDAKAAFAAMGRLAGSPAEAVALIGEKLKPATQPDLAVLAKLIADLGSDDFAVRERAQKELEAVGKGATGPLAEAARKGVSAEARKRAALIISKAEAEGASPDELRAARAVEVLERVGTPAARELLTKLATGDPGAVLTREAAAAAKRMK